MTTLKSNVEQKIKFHKEQLETLFMALTKLQEDIKKDLATGVKTGQTALNAGQALLLHQSIKKHQGSLEAYSDVLKDLP
jgi:flagellar biosynthesis chaperone FliJ